MAESTINKASSINKKVEILHHVTIRFAGDSGDGMQLAGMKFTTESVVLGNDVATFPDFPAEIRAPAGTLAGVSGFQVQFSSQEIYTPGDALDALVAMNPAALKVNLKDLKSGGILIVNEDSFNPNNVNKAGYKTNPLEDESLKNYKLFKVKMSSLHAEAVKDSNLNTKEVDLTKNFFALGLISWLYDRPLESTMDWINEKFKKKPNVCEANIKTLKAGYYYGETMDIFPIQFRVPSAKLKPGRYRKISGNEAIALGLLAASKLANKEIYYGSYPITPASDILHELSSLKGQGIKTLQAEDELAAIGSAIGASFGGDIAVTGTSGPGLALKSEALGLAIMLELPLIVIDVQRGGPSTGLPTKTEQADLLQVMFGRNGESPIPVIAPRSAGDCFDAMIMAVRTAINYMTPVVFLSDGYLANTAEPWLIPNINDYQPIEVKHPTREDYGENFEPYIRNKRLARPWAIPGTKDLEHRIGGLEKQDITGNVSYDPFNHEHMVRLREEKVNKVIEELPPLEINGPSEGDVLVLGWGSTHGAIFSAVKALQDEGHKVSHVHIRFVNPMNPKLGEIMKKFKKILIPELNTGQFRMLIRSKFLVDAKGLNKIQGRPFLVSEIEEKVLQLLKDIKEDK
ncbi:MAG: 2-oxoacid:acceptor oxidoreductase subunit alpha [Candidatus Thorarchaeota archaeon]